MKKTILALAALLSAFASYGQLLLPENVTASPSYLCPGSTATLSATVLSPNSVAWYTSPTGGTPFATTASGATTSVSPTVTTTYYAETVSPSGSATFSHTGAVQTWTVPMGVTQIMVDAKGASGANFSTSGIGGKGGRVTTLLNVTENSTLSIYVGGQGAVGSGGFNGFSGTNGSTARRGGGATDIRIGGTATTNRVLVAGGGGAASSIANGGNGGNPATAGTNGPVISGSTTSIGGGAATISAGGAAGTGVSAGTAGTASGLGGNGGTGTTPGGNGGGGYFGGGGGGSNSINTNRSAGGGGGSSYVDPSYLSGSAVYVPGDNTGNGSVTITWVSLTSASRVPVTITLTSPPTNLNVTNITHSGATFNWVAAAGVNEYEWQVVASGAGSSATPVASGNVANVTTNTIDLAPSTAYDLYVRSLCVSGGTSAWSAVRSFTTTAVYPPTVTLGTLQNPCNTANKPILILKYKNAQQSPDLYSLSADIPDFTEVIDNTLDGTGQILVDLTGTTPVVGDPYTVTITIKNSTTQATSTYTKSISFYDVPTNIPDYTTAGRVFADVECIDDANWTNYINTTNNELILSLTKGDWDPGTLVTSLTPTAGQYSVNVGFSGTLGYKLITASYVTTAPSWYIMDKSFDVKTPVQPSGDVPVRYYYTDAMYNAVNGQLASPITAPENLTIYKLKTGDSYTNLQNAHASVATADINFYNNTFTQDPYFNFVTGTLDGNTSVHYLDFNVNHFSGGGGGSASGGTPPTSGPGPYAVNLSAFSGYATPIANELAWQTLSETNNDKFEVEGSIDGKEFAKAGEVKSLASGGNSTKTLNYKFNDNMISNRYYRLKQFDIDGAVNYSNIIEISANSTSLLYPNPAKDNLYLVYTKASKYAVQITNLAGQVLMTLPASEEGFRQINVSEFPQGMYMLRIFDGQNRVLENMLWSK
jgi:hypothetical protein